MFVSGYLGGDSHVSRKKYQVSQAMANAGVLVLHPTLANTEGLRLTSTTSSEDCVGITLDTASAPITSAQSDLSDPERKVTVDINPLAVIRARFCGGATAGTALTSFANTVADTTRLLLTFAASKSTYDDGWTWGASGANAGQARKITAVTTTAVPITPFRYNIAVNDEFYFATFGPSEDKEVQFTSDFTEVDVTASNTSNKTMRCIEFEGPRSTAERGSTHSYGYFVISEHLYGGASI